MAEKWMQLVWDPIALAAQLRNITKQTQVLMRHFTSHEPDAIKFGVGQGSMLGFDFLEFLTRMMTDPAVVASAQIGLFYNMVGIWQKTAVRTLMLRAGEADTPKDRRFKHPEWSENAVFSLVRDSYLVAAASV